MPCGKELRLTRLFHKNSNRSVIVPMDHGATLGPIDGLADLRGALQPLCWKGDLIQGVVLHRGTMTRATAAFPARALPPMILHVSISTSLNPVSLRKSQIAWVEDALMLGADAISIHVNLGNEYESGMLRDFGALAAACQRWGMPLLCMIYVRKGLQTSADVADVKLAARVAAETGADIVKVSYPGSVEDMREVVNGCFIPVLIAGGDKTGSILPQVRFAMDGGAAGVCIGRNLFQATDSAAVLADIASIVHGQVVSAGKLSSIPDTTVAA